MSCLHFFSVLLQVLGFLLLALEEVGGQVQNEISS